MADLCISLNFKFLEITNTRNYQNYANTILGITNTILGIINTRISPSQGTVNIFVTTVVYYFMKIGFDFLSLILKIYKKWSGEVFSCSK